MLKNIYVWLALGLAGIVVAGIYTDYVETEYVKQAEMMVATGEFDIQLTPQTDDEIDAGRLLINKTFRGDLEGVSQGQMLSKRTEFDGSAGYVAIETFSGSLDGNQGSFTLQHAGTMNRGAISSDVTVVPDSGTGELRGISGTMQIIIADGQHSYEFDYVIE
jgi:hypothetical protein